MHTIEGKIIKILIDCDVPISSEAIANQIEVSSRTIKRYIKSISESNYLYGGEIISNKNGYLLSISESDKFSLINDININKKTENVDTAILCYLFTHKYSSIERISEEVFYNRNTVSKRLKEIKGLLKGYNIMLLSKSKYGLYLAGDELDIRRCFVEIFDENDFYIKQHIDQLTNYKFEREFIINCITDEFREKKIIKSNEEIRLMEKYIIVSMIRGDSGSINTDINKLSVNIDMLQSIENIIDKINQKFGFLLNGSMKYYLVGILGGNSITYDECEVVEEIIFETLSKLEIRYNERFLDNEVLINSLFQHLKATCQRLRLNIHLENPLKDKIKSKYYMSFEYAAILAKDINKVLNYNFSDDEIAYIALHFEGNNESKKEIERRRILIVCNNGVGTSELLKTKLINQLPILDVINVVPFYMVESYPLEQIDFIITTHPFENNTDKKVIVVSPILTERDIQNILNYIKISMNISYLKQLFNRENFHILAFNNKDQVMKHITEHLLFKKMITEELVDVVLNRENEYATEVGNMTAIPHCLVNRNSFMYVMILKKPIQWQNEKVQIIFFGGINPKEPESKKIFRYINKKISNSSSLKDLIKSSNYDEFLKKILI